MDSRIVKLGAAAGLVAAGLVGSPGSAEAFAVFSDNFNGAAVGSEWSTNVGTLEIDTASNAPNEKFLGANDAFDLGLSSQTVTLTLNNLGAHSEITLTFDLYILLTMDGNELFNLSVDGVGSLVTNGTFENLTAGGPTANNAASLAAFGIADAVDSLRVVDGNSGAVDDAAYRDSTFTFAHSASSLIVQFSYSSLQGLTDEGWSIDNVRVDSNFQPSVGVPEPATLGLLAAGLAALGLVRRRKA